MTQSQIDCAADALRRHEQGGRLLRDWSNLPNNTKRRWRDKAEIVLSAAKREADRMKASALLDGEFKEEAIHMKSLGWDFVPVGPSDWSWMKFNAEEKLIARAGDQTWWDDLRSYTLSRGY